MSLPPTILTRRLRLSLVSPAQAAELRAGVRHPSFAPGFPRPDDLAALSLIGLGLTGGDDPAAAGWGPRLVVRAHDGLICGTIGFFGPPEPEDEPEVEVGFGLVEAARGRGVATEALSGLMVEVDRSPIPVRARVAPDNAASLKVLTRCGFTRLRGGDEDGNLVVVRPGGSG